MIRSSDTTTTTTTSKKRDLDDGDKDGRDVKKSKKTKKLKLSRGEFKDTISLTFGDRAENHVGMQVLGELAEEGFTPSEIKKIADKFEEMGCKCELVQLNKLLEADDLKPEEGESTEAVFLIIRDGLSKLTGYKSAADKLYREQRKLDFDKKAKMRGRVVNKHARWNLCYAEKSQEPDYEAGKGRVVGFDEVPKLNCVRRLFPSFMGTKAKDLCAELNMYYDLKNCGIGFSRR